MVLSEVMKVSFVHLLFRNHSRERGDRARTMNPENVPRVYGADHRSPCSPPYDACSTQHQRGLNVREKRSDAVLVNFWRSSRFSDRRCRARSEISQHSCFVKVTVLQISIVNVSCQSLSKRHGDTIREVLQRTVHNGSWHRKARNRTGTSESQRYRRFNTAERPSLLFLQLHLKQGSGD